jgi:4-oxalocrotonate tautomerase
MPIVRIEMFPGRSHQIKTQVAEGITQLLEEKAGISPRYAQAGYRAIRQ